MPAIVALSNSHPDGRLIPFDTYNLFYRVELERTRLAPLRQRIEKIEYA